MIFSHHGPRWKFNFRTVNFHHPLEEAIIDHRKFFRKTSAIFSMRMEFYFSSWKKETAFSFCSGFLQWSWKEGWKLDPFSLDILFFLEVHTQNFIEKDLERPFKGLGKAFPLEKLNPKMNLGHLAIWGTPMANVDSSPSGQFYIAWKISEISQFTRKFSAISPIGGIKFYFTAK